MKLMNWPWRFVLLSVLSATLLANMMTIESTAIGIIGSLLFLFLNFEITGRFFFSGEPSFSRIFLGMASYVSIMAFVGSGLVFAGVFNEKVSIAALIALSFILFFLAERSPKLPLRNSTQELIKDKNRPWSKTKPLVLVFLSSIAAAFYLLLLGRTNEGGASVWLTIPGSFILVFLLASLLLTLIVLFSHLSRVSKLVLICIFTFLAHSLFLVIWYPGRYGDPWTHLGHARYVSKSGEPYGYAGLIQRNQFVDIIKYRALQVLVVFFERMFCIDIYWAFIALVPILWSILVPFLSYRISDSLSSGKSHLLPLVAALSTGIASPLITWGAISVPNSLGFIFLFLTVALIFVWMDNGGLRVWLTILLAAIVSFLVHPQTGVFAFMLFLFGTAVQKLSNRIAKVLIYCLVFAVYPFFMIFFGGDLLLEGLIALGSYSSFESEVTTILLVLGLVGLVLGVVRKYVDMKKTLLLLAFYFTVEFEYYFVRYGMTNLPFGAGRMLPIGFLLLTPLVALGLLTLADTMRNVVLDFSVNLIFKRAKVRLSLHKLGILLRAVVSALPRWFSTT